MNLELSIILSLCVAFMNTGGFYLQKSSQNQIPGNLTHGSYLLAALRSPRWLAGITLNLALMPIYIYAISIGHISITQPLANTGIILLVFIGLKHLKETIGKAEVVGLGLLISGIFMIAFSSPEPLETYHVVPDKVFTFISIMLALMCGCIVAIVRGKKAIGYAFLSGVAMAMAASVVKLISILIQDLGYTSFNLLDIEFDIALLLGIFGGELQLASFLFYTTAGLVFLNKVSVLLAFRNGKLVFVLPVQMGTSFMLPVIGGFLVFQEPFNVALLLGIAICLAGALILTKIQAAIEGTMIAAGPGS